MLGSPPASASRLDESSVVHVELCHCCGRADEALSPLPPMSINRRYHVSEHLVNKGTNHVADGAEKYALGGCCPLCTTWATEFAATRDAKWWYCYWPSTTAYLLGTNHATLVWSMLPPSVRYAWRGLHFEAAGNALSVFDAPGFCLGHPTSNPEALTSCGFNNMAILEAQRDTKCACCRHAMCPDEIAWLPMWRLNEATSWMPANIQAAVKVCLHQDDNGQWCQAARLGNRSGCFEHLLCLGRCNARTIPHGYPCALPRYSCRYHQGQQEDHLPTITSSTDCSTPVAPTSATTTLLSVPTNTHCTITNPTQPQLAQHSYSTRATTQLPAEGSFDGIADFDVALSSANHTTCQFYIQRMGRQCRARAQQGTLRCATHRNRGAPTSTSNEGPFGGDPSLWDMLDENVDEEDDVLHASDPMVDVVVDVDYAASEADDVAHPADGMDEPWGFDTSSDSDVDANAEEIASMASQCGESDMDHPSAAADLVIQPDNEPSTDAPMEGIDRLHSLSPGWNHVAPDPLLAQGIRTCVMAHPLQGLAIAVCQECHSSPKRHFFSVIWPYHNTSWYAKTQVACMDTSVHETTYFSPPCHADLFFLSPVRIYDITLCGASIRTDILGRWKNPRYQMLALVGDGRGLSTQYVALDHSPINKLKFSDISITHRAMYIQTLMSRRRDLDAFWIKLYGADALTHLPSALPDDGGFVWNHAESLWVAKVKYAPEPMVAENERHTTVVHNGPPGWVAPRVMPKTPNNALGSAMQVLMQLRILRHLTPLTIPATRAVWDMQCIIHSLLQGDKADTTMFNELRITLRAQRDDIRLTAMELACAPTVLRTLLWLLHMEVWNGSADPSLPKFYLSRFAAAHSWAPMTFGIPAVYKHSHPLGCLLCPMALLDTNLRLLRGHLNHICGPILLIWFDCTALAGLTTETPPIPGDAKVLDRYELRAILGTSANQGPWCTWVRGRRPDGNVTWMCCSQNDAWEAFPPNTAWKGRSNQGYLLVFENNNLLPQVDVQDPPRTPTPSSHYTLYSTTDRVTNTDPNLNTVFGDLDNEEDITFHSDNQGLDDDAETTNGYDTVAHAGRLDTADAVAYFGAILPPNDDEPDAPSGNAALHPTGGGDRPDSSFMAGIYVQDALEYLTGSPTNTTGVHVLLSTLAELNTRRNMPSQWVRTLVSTVTSRLPETQNVGEYMEAFMFAEHFATHDSIGGHYPGCMPLRMYSKKTMAGGSRGFVAFERYVRDVLNDPYSSRSHDSSWISFAFNVSLMRLFERGPPLGGGEAWPSSRAAKPE